MMTRFTMTLLLLAAAATAGVRAQCLSPDDGGGAAAGMEAEATEAETAALRQARTEFALALLRESSTAGEEGGAGAAVVSPRSAFDALSLALLGAANATERALRDTLRLPQELTKAGAWRALRADALDEGKDLGEGEGVRSVSRVWLAQEVALRPCLTQLLKEAVENVDLLGDTQNAVARINAWVADRTGGRIRDLVPSNLHPHAQMVLTNAAVFRGLWASRFPHNATTLQVFHTAPDRRTLVPMMKQRGSFSYVASERLGAHALELPFKQDEMSLLLLLPPFASPAAAGGVEGGVDALLGRLDAAALGELLRDADGSTQTVDVEMPRLALEATIDLVPVLKRLGVGDTFSQAGDFSSFTGEPGPTFDGVLQRARLEADEEGATAAAATAIFLFRSARPVDPPRFIANHPFVFLLLRRYSASASANAAAPPLSAAAVDILFAGVYRGPPPGAAARFVREA